MPKYPLVPFKAYFEYNHSQRISETLSNTIWERAFEKSNSITSKWFIYSFHSGFNIPYLQEGTVVDLELNEIHSTSPDILHVKDYEKILSFKINSKPFTVTENTDKIITFYNKNNQGYTISKNDDLVLVVI